MESGSWTWFDHTADIGLVVSAPSFETLFPTAARALFDLLIEDRAGPPEPPFNERAVALEAADAPELLIRWLSELLYLHETEHLVFRGLEVTSLSDHQLIGVISWEPLDRTRQRVRREIKGITYHQVTLEETTDGWRARLVFDV